MARDAEDSLSGGDHGEMASDSVDSAMAWDGLRLLGPIWDELARRMGASSRPVRRIKVSGLDAQGRRTLASLLGLLRLPYQRTVVIDVAKVGSALGLEAAYVNSLSRKQALGSTFRFVGPSSTIGCARLPGLVDVAQLRFELFDGG